jgi:hypothetical protein
METRKKHDHLPCKNKRDFFINEKQKELWNVLETKKEKWYVYETLIYPNIDIREISTRKNNSLLISSELINSDESWKYIEIKGEKFHELNKWWKRKIWNFYYIDKSTTGEWVFHIGKITGFEKWYNREYAVRKWQSMRKDWSIHNGNALIDIE